MFFLRDKLLKDRGHWTDLVIQNLQKVETLIIEEYMDLMNVL